MKKRRRRREARKHIADGRRAFRMARDTTLRPGNIFNIKYRPHQSAAHVREFNSFFQTRATGRVARLVSHQKLNLRRKRVATEQLLRGSDTARGRKSEFDGTLTAQSRLERT